MTLADVDVHMHLAQASVNRRHQIAKFAVYLSMQVSVSVDADK